MPFARAKHGKHAALLALTGLLLQTTHLQAEGVTVITHGLNGTVDGWITGMANQIPAHSTFPGTTRTFYKVYFLEDTGGWTAHWARLGGVAPSESDSGEIIVVFDWNQLADGNSYDTTEIAPVLSTVLQSPTFISELNGHALAERPLHLIGHSRGGSLVCETARLLGTSGCWVDQVTTLDPHPLNDPAFPLDWILYSAADAPARAYENVLFQDNYWQELDSFVYGRDVPGTYERELFTLSGGYQDIGETYYEHSNAHLWYHATVDRRNPADDTEAQVTSTEFASWYTTYENYGLDAGFLWSRIGTGDRTSSDLPQGSGYPAIRDGYNQNWDLGAGQPQTPNRTALTSVTGNWPNPIRFDLTSSRQIEQGTSADFTLYYQWAQPQSSNALLQIYLDTDWNPLNGNEQLLTEGLVPGTTADGVTNGTVTVPFPATNAPAGSRTVFARLASGDSVRYLYERYPVEIMAVAQPLVLDAAVAGVTNLVIGINGAPGQIAVLERSEDALLWLPIATNTLSSARWESIQPITPGTPLTLFRAVAPAP